MTTASRCCRDGIVAPRAPATFLVGCTGRLSQQYTGTRAGIQTTTLGNGFPLAIRLLGGRRGLQAVASPNIPLLPWADSRSSPAHHVTCPARILASCASEYRLACTADETDVHIDLTGTPTQLPVFSVPRLRGLDRRPCHSVRPPAACCG